MNLLSLSWKNLLHKPLSMTLSLVLFALGVGLISLLLLLNKQLEEQFEKNMAGIDLVIGAKGSPLQLILSSMFHVDVPTGNIAIEEARPFLRPGHPLIETAVPLSLGDSYKTYRIVGTTPDILTIYGATLDEGKLWKKPMEVTLGAGVAESLGLKTGDRFQSTHGLADEEDLLHEDAEAFHVVGILQPAGSVIDQLILTSSQSVWAVHGHEEGAEPEDEHQHEAAEIDRPLYEMVDQEITAMLIKFKARNVQTLNMPRGINENTTMLAANPSYEISKLFDQIGVGEKILRVLAIVIVIVSSFSIFISLFNSLKERKYELAILRTLGASPGRLFTLIILEGLILAVLGYLLGTVLSHAGMEFFAGYLKNAYRYSFTGRIFLNQEWLLLAGALLIGFVAAVLPAIQARNTDIHETLAEG